MELDGTKRNKRDQYQADIANRVDFDNFTQMSSFTLFEQLRFGLYSNQKSVQSFGSTFALRELHDNALRFVIINYLTSSN